MIDSNPDEKELKSVITVATTISVQTHIQWPAAQSASSHGCLAKQVYRDLSGYDTERNTILDNLGPPPPIHALLLDTEFSSASASGTINHATACREYARENSRFVMGFLAQSCMNESEGDNFIAVATCTQGHEGKDKQDRNHMIRDLIKNAGTDVVIVDSAVLSASYSRSDALEYRQQGWAAYVDRIGSRESARV